MPLPNADTGSGRWLPLPLWTARVVSDLLNPLLIPTCVFLLLGRIGHAPAGDLLLAASLSALFYGCVPLAITVYYYLNGKVASLDVPDQKSRNRLFVLSILSSTTGSLLLMERFYLTQPLFAATAFVFGVNVVMGYLINLRWKISIHTAAVAAAGTLFLSLSLWEEQLPGTRLWILSLLFLLILLPLVTWARYHLRIHSVSELVGGSLAGAAFTLAEMSILMKIW
jgi:hypothetical protein